MYLCIYSSIYLFLYSFISFFLSLCLLGSSFLGSILGTRALRGVESKSAEFLELLKPGTPGGFLSEFAWPWALPKVVNRGAYVFVCVFIFVGLLFFSRGGGT